MVYHSAICSNGAELVYWNIIAELNGLMPRVQGGTGQYLLAGMGPLPSLIGNLSAYVITEILSMTAEITLCGLVLKGLFLPHVDNRIISIIIMALFLVINLLV